MVLMLWRPVRLTVYPESRLELVLLKQNLIHRLLNGREVEVRLGDDDAGVCELHLNTQQPAEEEVGLD